MIPETDCTEEWRTIPSWPLYEVSSLGRVRRKVGDRHRAKAGFILKQYRQKDKHTRELSYPFVRLSKGTTKSFKFQRVHYLTAEAFIGPRPDGYDINHLDGNRANPLPGNLEYCTRSQNIIHSVLSGLRKQTKLTAEQAKEIYESPDKLTELAAKYGIVFQSVSDIWRGKTWAHVTRSLHRPVRDSNRRRASPTKISRSSRTA